MADRLLDTVHSPDDLRPLSLDECARLGQEIRALITDAVAAHGGHLASNLGVVDLTIALHRVFDFARDRLVWDVGHQCYAHKILTGRGSGFARLRQAGGVSGFPNPDESPYDLFRTGHAGASISTALGLALADRAAGRDVATVAVIGDGALACGLALEGLNHAGDIGANLLVVLNDNQMAISPTVGALARCLTDVRARPGYDRLKHDVHEVLDRVPMGDSIAKALRTVKDAMKDAVVPDHALEHFGFRSFGPVEGHDVAALTEALEAMKALSGPRLLHVHTQKGHGFAPAAESPESWHSAKPFAEKNGRVVPCGEAADAAAPPTWTRAAVDALIEQAKADPSVVAITAAMPEGSGLLRFAHRFPDRFFDVGICEQHAVALAAGLARGGRRPVVAIYSTFLQRAYDQLFHEIALQGLPVLFLADRAGLVGADGPTHHGLYDVAYLRHLPGFTLAAPADRDELGGMMRAALAADGPWVIRYPRDCVPERALGQAPVEIGRGVRLREGADGALLAYGATAPAALDAAEVLADEGLNVAVASARFAKPVDVGLVEALLAAAPWVLAIEDHTAAGGFGSAVLEAAEARGLDTRRIHRLAVGEALVEHDTRAAQLAAAGLTAEGVAERARAFAARAHEHHAGPGGA